MSYPTVFLSENGGQIKTGPTQRSVFDNSANDNWFLRYPAVITGQE